jgi:hypothetical protein
MTESLPVSQGNDIATLPPYMDGMAHTLTTTTTITTRVFRGRLVTR